MFTKVYPAATVVAIVSIRTHAHALININVYTCPVVQAINGRTWTVRNRTNPTAKSFSTLTAEVSKRVVAGRIVHTDMGFTFVLIHVTMRTTVTKMALACLLTILCNTVAVFAGITRCLFITVVTLVPIITDTVISFRTIEINFTNPAGARVRITPR